MGAYLGFWLLIVACFIWMDLINNRNKILLKSWYLIGNDENKNIYN